MSKLPNIPDPENRTTEHLATPEVKNPIHPYPWNPYPWPSFSGPVSGLYEWKSNLLPGPFISNPQTVNRAEPEQISLVSEAQPGGPGKQPPVWWTREELRLDVDGLYPQMTASGTRIRSIASGWIVHWIANLQAYATVGENNNLWKGNIWYKDGYTAWFPYTDVQIIVKKHYLGFPQNATVEFTGGGGTPLSVTYKFKSPYFHQAEFEYDAVTGITPTTQIQTHDHPNHPVMLPNETLSIKKVYQRAGMNVSLSNENSIVPLAGAGQNERWSDAEMHDAMQAYWSQFSSLSKWAMWVFFANQHHKGSGTGGTMFDDIGPNHRQGTAIFYDSFISEAPDGYPDPAAWVKRMHFWTAVHEMGHAFNLAHSWDKAYELNHSGHPWIPGTDEPEARSFMNYPYSVSGGQETFFNDFEFRFSDEELLFLRHAPSRFVQMGNADWFDHHGFEQGLGDKTSTIQLEIRVNREKPRFEFLEPIVCELKLKNTSSEPLVVDAHTLLNKEYLTVIVKKQGKAARQWIPFSRLCLQPKVRVLKPGEALYETVFLSVGRNGWDVAEPGSCLVQVSLRHKEGDVVSNGLRLIVSPPKNYDEEYLAQDFFTDEVGRILTFDGSRVLTTGLNTLSEVIDRLPNRRVAIHSKLALANTLRLDYKTLQFKSVGKMNGPACAHGTKIQITSAKEKEAEKQLSACLMKDADLAAETLSHIDYKLYVDEFSDWLKERGRDKEAVDVQKVLRKTLSARKVKKEVLMDIERKKGSYEKAKRLSCP